MSHNLIVPFFFFFWPLQRERDRPQTGEIFSSVFSPSLGNHFCSDKIEKDKKLGSWFLDIDLRILNFRL